MTTAYLQALRDFLRGFCFLSFSIQLGVVLMMYAENALLKQGQVARMHSNAVVLFAPALLHVVPPPFLLQQIQTYTQRRHAEAGSTTVAHDNVNFCKSSNASSPEQSRTMENTADI